MRTKLLSILFIAISLGNSEFVRAASLRHFQTKVKLSRLNWKNLTTIDQLRQAYPGRIRKLFDALDLGKKGLEEVQKAIQSGDTTKACKTLLNYYRNSDSGDWLRDVKQGLESDYMNQARNLLDNRVTLASTTDKIPLQPNGGWMWNYTGPNQDKEFGYSLNGHTYLLALLHAWKQSGEQKFARSADVRIRDWILHNPLPAKGDSVYKVLKPNSNLGWRDIREVRWRDLEVGDRLGQSWPQLFYGLQTSKVFSPATRLLMLSSIPEQAEYLKKYHKKGHNWTTVEMDGLSLAGLAFPEFKQADEWATYALKVMEKEINRQVYPDGVQTELSTMTHLKSLSHFQSVADHFYNAGRSVPSSYRNGLEKMYNYLAYSIRPNGYQPLNNDSDRNKIYKVVLNAAKKFNRSDWEWIATNGKAGKKPENLPSKVFPWAGINIMRDGWGRDAQWAFFDTGPFGTGHQHSDMLHLSVMAYGKNLLVDGGRYTHKNYWSFDPTTWRGYFRSSFSHNVILVDGKGQNHGPVKAKKPLKEGIDYINKPSYDYARGTFKSGFNEVKGDVKHTRAVFYLRGKYWVVVDRIDTDRPRKLDVLWHYAPDCRVEEDGKTVRSINTNAGNLQITPIGSISWKLQIVKGQTEPVIQGWYGAVYGEKVPNPSAVYSASVDHSMTFAWVLVPAKGEIPPVNSKMLKKSDVSVTLQITEDGQKPINLSIPIAGKKAPEFE